MGRLPFATWNPIRNCPGIPYIPGARKRGVLHSTEGGYDYVPRGDGSYLGVWTPPQITVARNGVFQHIDTDLAGYAMVNLMGGVETNRQGALQIEVCGRAADAQTWPAETYVNLALTMRWLEHEHGVRPEPYDGFHPYPRPPGIYEGLEPWRMSFGVWNGFDGWCGHQHVPENKHGDPGAIRIDLLFPKDKPPTNEVAPMYDPPLGPIVASCPGPGGQGALLLGADAGVYIVGGAPVAVPPGWVIGPNGQSYWADRSPARISCDAANHWVVTATSGETYDYPHAPG